VTNNCRCVSDESTHTKMTRFATKCCTSCGRFLKSKVFTQKAKGILELGGEGNRPPTTMVNAHYVVKSTAGLDIYLPWAGETMARPCPMKPRPGFVDSRMVETVEDVKGILKEIKKAGEPNGELLITRYIDAPHSGILNNNSITVGGGTDGATTGKDAYVFPLLEPVFHTPGHHVELLWHTVNSIYAVQKRAAIDVPVKKNHITNPGGTVYYVHTPDSSDLLAWETKLQGLKPGSMSVAVAHLPGQPLTSHFALHAIMMGMNVITGTKKPKEGDIFPDADEDWAPALQNYDPSFIKKVLTKKGNIENGQLMLAMSILHHWPAFENTDLDHKQKLFEFSVGYLLKAGIIACFGEMRHHLWKSSFGTCGCKNKACIACCYANGTFKKSRGQRPPRDHVYNRVANTMPHALKLLPKYVEDFLNPIYWDGGSIGGPKWAEIMQQCHWTLKVLENGNKIEHVKQSWNILANLVHNNAKWITKFSGYSVSQMTMHAMPAYYDFMKGKLI
jgi:hypothetical protein